MKNLRRTADIVFPRRRIAVFVDGCFWHGCPQHHTIAKTNPQFWDQKVRRTMERDRETEAQLAAEGWLVIRIWEHVPVDEAVESIINALTSPRKDKGI